MWDFLSTYFRFSFCLAISFPTPSMQRLLLDTGGAQPYVRAISKVALCKQECDMYLMGARDRNGDSLIPPPQPWWKPHLMLNKVDSMTGMSRNKQFSH